MTEPNDGRSRQQGHRLARLAVPKQVDAKGLAPGDRQQWRGEAPSSQPKSATGWLFQSRAGAHALGHRRRYCRASC